MAKKEKEKKTEEKEIECAEQEKEQETEQNQEKSELEKISDQLLRTAAEYDNYRKRTARERIELEADITSRVVSGFLPVADNLERALGAECKDENYKKGVEMIYNSFAETLKALGVEEITDEDFNPAYHQAVQHVQDENLDSGKVAQVFQKGYKIGEKVIRFAMVAVTN